MRALRLTALSSLILALVACGEVRVQKTQATARQVLTEQPELLELEPLEVRQELFRDLARLSVQERGQSGEAPVLFPMSVGSRLIAAPALDVAQDLLLAPDAGVLLLTFDGRERWPEDRHESLGGLSEREAAELVARSLLTAWGVEPAGEVQVDRASSAPYAAAYLDGILRINPAFLYLAASVPAGGVPQQP